MSAPVPVTTLEGHWVVAAQHAADCADHGIAVGQTVGYAGQSAFGAAFRRATGWTPSAWRRERTS